jgi:hypothetical protein
MIQTSTDPLRIGRDDRRRLRGSRARRGYSFPEVLFAVIVLGIGFIMIAAVFPVAIQQSKATSDETIAATAARAGVATVTALGQQASANFQYNVLPATGTGAGTPGKVAPITSRPGSHSSWAMLRGNLVFQQDPRYAFVPLYRRSGDPASPGTWGATAQIYIITVQCRSNARPQGATVSINGKTAVVPQRTTQEFDLFDYGIDLNPPPPSGAPITNYNNLAPRRVKIKDIKDNPAGDGLDVLTFDLNNQKKDETGQNLPAAAAQGCFVIMEATGQIYRLGAPRDEPNGVWELVPGSDLPDNTFNVTNVDAFIVGREWVAPYGTNNFIGNAQDISIFTSFIPVAQ